VDGGDVAFQAGTYGTLGTAAASNVPGARYSATGSTDASGNLWLFGGEGEDSTGSHGGLGYLNDLWKYSTVAGEWTWVSGSSTADAAGIYGTKGTAAAGNVPGGRIAPSSWVDASGNFWVFGGEDSSGSLNDLWKYSPGTGEWTWEAGSTNSADGTYGTLGKAAAGNTPGARRNAVTWTDAEGNLWLFGGSGCDATGTEACLIELNDLWKFSPSTGQWAWMSGSNAAAQNGTYGTEGTAAQANVPGARSDAMGWIDSSGNLWLFGGEGYDSVGTQGGYALLNDLWKYSPSTSEWTWMSGSNVAFAVATYGTEGTAAAGNAPGSRYGGFTWADSSGDLWLFGGWTQQNPTSENLFNDLWRYSTSTGEWTWMGGSDAPNEDGIYGTLGTAAAGNIPGAREDGVSWTDSSGNFWIFGGKGYDSVGTDGGTAYTNDFFKFTP
jgi:N-acetylneuraminic acid mutarotase